MQLREFLSARLNKFPFEKPHWVSLEFFNLLRRKTYFLFRGTLPQGCSNRLSTKTEAIYHLLRGGWDNPDCSRIPNPPLTFKGSLVDPRLRASNEHILIVRVPRARRLSRHPAPHFSPSCLEEGHAGVCHRRIVSIGDPAVVAARWKISHEWSIGLARTAMRCRACSDRHRQDAQIAD